MIKSNEEQTTADETEKQLRAYQLEAALCLIEDKIDALIKTNRKFFDEWGNHNCGVDDFNPRVEVRLEDRSQAIMELFAAQAAYQRLVS